MSESGRGSRRGGSGPTRPLRVTPPVGAGSGAGTDAGAGGGVGDESERDRLNAAENRIMELQGTCERLCVDVMRLQLELSGVIGILKKSGSVSDGFRSIVVREVPQEKKEKRKGEVIEVDREGDTDKMPALDRSGVDSEETGMASSTKHREEK